MFWIHAEYFRSSYSSSLKETSETSCNWPFHFISLCFLLCWEAKHICTISRFSLKLNFYLFVSFSIFICECVPCVCRGTETPRKGQILWRGMADTINCWAISPALKTRKFWLPEVENCFHEELTEEDIFFLFSLWLENCPLGYQRYWNWGHSWNISTHKLRSLGFGVLVRF